nr:MAG TPA: hypothetical protein [Caudoviricetes sp.]
MVYLHICGFISTFVYRKKVVRLTKPAPPNKLNQLNIKIMAEIKCITYKNHVIQKFEDIDGYVSVLIDFKTEAVTINNAKRIINTGCSIYNY